MSSWVAVPCLLALRDEFNAVSPNRDKGADGLIGDSNHNSTSDHTPDEDSSSLKNKDSDTKNEVHGLDTDSTGPWPDGPQWFDDVFHEIIRREKAKWDDPDDKCRLSYAIWNRKIYDKDNDFIPVDYEGSNPHTDHAHFSARYETSCENDTRPWGVEESAMPSIEEIRAVVKDEIAKGAGPATWNHMEENPESTTEPKEKARMGGWARMEEQRQKSRQSETNATLAEIQNKINEALGLLAALTPCPPKPEA